MAAATAAVAESVTVVMAAAVVPPHLAPRAAAAGPHAHGQHAHNPRRGGGWCHATCGVATHESANPSPSRVLELRLTVLTAPPLTALPRTPTPLLPCSRGLSERATQQRGAAWQRFTQRGRQPHAPPRMARRHPPSARGP